MADKNNYSENVLLRWSFLLPSVLFLFMYLLHPNCQTVTVTKTCPFNWSGSLFEVYLTYFRFWQEFDPQAEESKTTSPWSPFKRPRTQHIYPDFKNILTQLTHSTLSCCFTGARKWHYSYFFGPRQRQQKDWIFVGKESSVCGALSCTLWLVSVRQSKDADHSKSQAKLLGGGHFIFLAFLRWFKTALSKS